MPSSNFLTDRSKAVFLFVNLFRYLLFLFVFANTRFCLLQPCSHLLGKSRPLGSIECDVVLCFITFLSGALGQVWHLIVSIPDLCLLPYF